MIIKLLVLSSTWTICSFSELYDVTTIYRVDEPAGGIETSESQMSAEIHARTNALGLPFLVAGNVVEPEIGVEVPRCVALRLSDVRCDWELDNWDWTVWEHSPLLDTGDWSELQVTGLASKYLRFDDALFIRFNGLVHNQSYIHIVFTPNRAYIQNQERFYYLQLSRLHQSFFHRCDNRIFERFTRFKDLDENIIAIHCHKIANVTVQMERWTFGKVDAENYLLVEINKNGTVQLWNTKARTVPMMVWVDPQPIPINFFTIRTDEAGNAQVSAINYGKGQVLSMAKNANTASIISPPLSLSSNKLCVSLVYHTRGATTPTVVSVSSTNQTISLGELRNQQDGWKVERFKATLPDSMSEDEVRIHIKSVKEEGELHIQRIAGCNADDDEDIATIFVLGGFSTPSDRVAYSVAVRPSAGSFHKPEFIMVGDCENGGLVYSEGKCACPAGFTGNRCQTGCGANRYGQDCGGLCSLRQQECRGLTLCTPIVGCFCAPGYKGYHCNETCEGRQYGAGCTQRCVNCAGRCDPYTGVCTTVCKPGYYPPYCKTEYSYTQFAPHVNVSNYGEVIVTPDIYNTLGQGKPAFYQVQYKWTVYHSLPITASGDSLQDVVIQGLRHGVRYDVRVVLIDQDLNSYQGALVPYNQFLTSCYVPEEYDYQVKAETTDTSVTLSWVYEPEHKYSCPVVNYELSWQEGWRWLSHNVTNTTATLLNKLPVTQYRLRVRALTSADYAPYSETVTVRTAKRAPGPISNLTLIQSTNTSLTFAWNPPLDKEHYKLNYVITYECRKLAACEHECSGAGEAHVVEPQVTLPGLHPLAQYVVTVAAADSALGANVSIVQATQQAVPTEVALPSPIEHQVSDSAATVYWEPADVCSGFFLEYAFQLFKGDDITSPLSSGTTQQTFVLLEDLEPKSVYRVKIFIVTSGGWNPEKFLWINVTTKASVAGAVQQLEVYKTGRQTVGLHWSRPLHTYGDLAAFLVSFESAGDKGPMQHREVKEETARCVIWPDSYCYTVDDLIPDTNYTFTVTARNLEIPEYGPAESVTASTNEKAPEKPASLQILNVTSTSFAVSWGFPLRANGILRSFLVTLAETERVDYEHCCKQFPNIEIPVDVEQATYETEIVGLNPASTYAVSVTGKTIVLGASVSLTVHTRPPPLPLVSVPAVRVSGVAIEWLPPQTVPQVNSQLYLPLVRGNMVVILSAEERTMYMSGVRDSQLYELMRSTLNSSFFTVSDYRGNGSVSVSAQGAYEGLWGTASWKLVSGETYRAAAVQVTKYFKAYSVDVLLSQPFKLDESNLIDFDDDY